MRKNSSLLVAVLIVTFSAAGATEPSGRQMFVQHCAPCHGEKGKGDGPVAASLKTPPSNLTTLSKRKVSEASLIEYIDGRREVAAHGPREMPVWGGVFDAELADKPYAGYTVLLKSKILAEYIFAIQAR